MPNIMEGQLNAAGLKLAIVSSRFNDFITQQLQGGALDAIRRTGGDPDGVDIYRAPGAFEIPGLLRQVLARGGLKGGGYDAIICLGAVIRGATPHFEYIAAEVTKGIAQLQLTSDIPLAYGILTPDTVEQAIERAGTKAGNKGFDAAMAAIEMATLYKALRSGTA